MRTHLLTALLPLAMSLPLQAAVVYDNTTNYTGSENFLLAEGATESTQHGSVVTLAGDARSVTSVSVVMRIHGEGVATFNAHIRFYDDDGDGGSPGTLLWESDPIPTLVDSGAPILFTTSVPNIVVPDTFIWTIQVSNRMINMARLGPSLYDPPTIGSASFGYWRLNATNGNWFFLGDGEEPPFGARVVAEAVPACPADLDASGAVDFADIIAVLSAWGPCPTDGTCPEDLNHNGEVDFGDLLVLLGNWGPCPS